LAAAPRRRANLANLRAIDPSQLPRQPGVYVITSGDARQHYVGLALDLYWRFHNPEYGHLSTNNRTRSRPIILDSGRQIRLVKVWPVEPAVAAHEPSTRVDLARMEIDTYARLVLDGGNVLNSVAMLGRVGESTGMPVILCAHADGTYVYCDTLALSMQFAASTAIPAVVHGYQRTAVGYTARWATEREVDALAGYAIPGGIVRGPRVGRAVAADARDVMWSGHGRNAGFRWTSGPLSVDDLAHLNRYARSRYNSGIPRSRFHGVSWESHSGGWQCRAKTGPGAKDLWQTTRRQWQSDVDAAIFREDKVVAEGWQRFNSGRYASNAAELNDVLGQPRFRGW
jgi:hypothetical protein